MRFLANENFPLDAVEALRRSGHDVGWVRTDAPGSTDRQVLERAVAEDRVLLTFDKDFAELSFHARVPAPCGIVLFRIPQSSSSQVAAVVSRAIALRDDWPRHFAVVETHRIRIRTVPSCK
jgi:predicted nuclease of predicted toxin-antitoxin system